MTLVRYRLREADIADLAKYVRPMLPVDLHPRLHEITVQGWINMILEEAKDRGIKVEVGNWCFSFDLPGWTVHNAIDAHVEFRVDPRFDTLFRVLVL